MVAVKTTQETTNIQKPVPYAPMINGPKPIRIVKLTINYHKQNGIRSERATKLQLEID